MRLAHKIPALGLSTGLIPGRYILALAIAVALALAVYASVYYVSISLMLLAGAIQSLYFFSLFFILDISRCYTQPAIKYTFIFFSIVALEILLSFFNWPASLAPILLDLHVFRSLLPFVGSELALAAYLTLFIFIATRFSVLRLLVLFSLLFPYQPTVSENNPPATQLRVALIQTNLPDTITRFPGLPGHLEYWLAELKSLANGLDSQSYDLAVLPESTLPGFSPQITPLVKDILRPYLATPLIAHRYTDRGDKSYLSSATHWSAGILARQHFKARPIPFAERHVAPGRSAVFQHKDWVISPFICSDSLATYNARGALKQADIGVVIANAEVIMDSVLADLQLKVEQLRAAEMGKPIVRAANAGLSGYIAANGDLINSANRWQSQVTIAKVAKGSGSFFADWYQIIHLIFLLDFIMFLIIFPATKNPSTSTKKYSILMITSITVLIAGQSLFREKLSNAKKISVNIQHFADFDNELDFPLRQFGVATHFDPNNSTRIKALLKTEVLDLEDINPTQRGIGIIQTDSGPLYIMDKIQHLFLVMKQNKLYNLTRQELAAISLGPALWITYNTPNHQR